jgi:hypothetical protein
MSDAADDSVELTCLKQQRFLLPDLSIEEKQRIRRWAATFLPPDALIEEKAPLVEMKPAARRSIPHYDSESESSSLEDDDDKA